MVIEDLARGAADLLSITNTGPVRSLNRLAELAVWQVPACSGAAAMVCQDSELAGMTATHPDLAALTEFQLATGSGPAIDVLRTGEPCGCGDTLHESRWPGYASEALRRGVRCVVAVMHSVPPTSVILSLYGVRPHSLDGRQVPVASTLSAFGGVVLAKASAYDDAQREALQLKDAVASRAVVDQAKGIMMHALGCDAVEALDRMRRVSQRRHIKVTDVAGQIVEAHDDGLPERPREAPPRQAARHRDPGGRRTAGQLPRP